MFQTAFDLIPFPIVCSLEIYFSHSRRYRTSFSNLTLRMYLMFQTPDQTRAFSLAKSTTLSIKINQFHFTFNLHL